MIPRNYGPSSRRTDWSRFGTRCETCIAAPFAPCLDTRKYTPVIKTRPHNGRRVTVRVYRGKALV